MKKGQAIISGALAIILAVMAGIVIYLVFVFPKALAIWEQEARELTSIQMILVNLSDFCKRYGLILFPVFVLGFLVSSVKMMLTIKKASATNNTT